jgi:hypothetical protein
LYSNLVFLGYGERIQRQKSKPGEKEMRIATVENMQSPQGKDVPNQFLIHTDTGVTFQSYSSIIAQKRDGKVYLDQNKWDYSRTTLKYLNLFLRTSGKKEIEAGIKSGAFILADLNN